jgi:hypothetical protein
MFRSISFEVLDSFLERAGIDGFAIVVEKSRN